MCICVYVHVLGNGSAKNVRTTMNADKNRKIVAQMLLQYV
jgi:hypothetical protein